MDKPNVFKSSNFHMDSGDVLHMLFLDETGVTMDVDLWSSETTTETLPDAPTALDASDISDSSFTANWYFNENTTGYYLDVATDSAFTAMVVGYNNLDVGNVSNYGVAGLVYGTIYYYRIRAYNNVGTSSNSDPKTLVTNYMLADDWFLPSEDELNLMYTNLWLFGLGDFVNDFFWSSTEASQYNARAQRFTDGLKVNASKTSIIYTMPCRKFTDALGIYTLRGIGPAGGYIFYITGVTCYECAPNRIFTILTWSNIVDVLIGTTSPDIGEGQNNTNEIIAQPGHITSAAKLCDDLIT